jgi:hypothetical protein
MRIPLRVCWVSQVFWEKIPSPFLRPACLFVSFFVCPPPPTPTPGPAFSTSLSLWSSVLRVHVFLSLPFVATVRRPGFIVPLDPPSSSGFPNFLASILLWPRFSGPTSSGPFFGVLRRLTRFTSTCVTRTIGGPEPVTPLSPLFVGIVFLCPFSPLLRWDLASHLTSSLSSPI